jgi:para-nitrobenzyl esterase
MQPDAAARAGRVADVPLIQGGTRDEMRRVVADLLGIADNPLTDLRYQQIVRGLYGPDAATVLAHYSPQRYSTPSLALATLQTDEGRMVGWCTQLAYNEAHRRRAPVYSYEFAEDSKQTSGDLPLGASHGDDIPYFFDSYFGDAPADRPAASRQGLAAELIHRWTAFAHSGRPGAGWVPNGQGAALSMSSTRVGLIDAAQEHQCGFWRSTPSHQSSSSPSS